MLAAADCAEKNAEPPPELKAAWDAETFGIPPVSGGREDQPAGLLDKMRKCMNIYNALTEQKRIASGNMSADQQREFYASPTGKTCIAIKQLREQHGTVNTTNHNTSG